MKVIAISVTLLSGRSSASTPSPEHSMSQDSLRTCKRNQVSYFPIGFQKPISKMYSKTHFQTCLRRKSFWTRLLGSSGQHRVTHLSAVVVVEVVEAVAVFVITSLPYERLRESSFPKALPFMVAVNGGKVNHFSPRFSLSSWNVSVVA